MTPEHGLWAASLALIAASAGLFWALRDGGWFDRHVDAAVGGPLP